MSQQNRAFQPPGFNNSSSWREKGFLSLTWVRKIIQKILSNIGKRCFRISFQLARARPARFCCVLIQYPCSPFIWISIIHARQAQKQGLSEWRGEMIGNGVSGIRAGRCALAP
ncbi:MAG: hypothetical protein ACFNZS_04085 [Ottowia sp.]